jgi:hypothetical protein
MMIPYYVAVHGSDELTLTAAGILSCLDGYMNIALEQTEVRGTLQQQLTTSVCALLHATDESNSCAHTAAARVHMYLDCVCLSQGRHGLCLPNTCGSTTCTTPVAAGH